MRALGFGDPIDSYSDKANVAGPDQEGRESKSSVQLSSRTTITLKGLSTTVDKGKGTVRLPMELLQTLKSLRVEIEQEIVALEGAPSVSAAVREMRLHSSLSEVRTGVETALTIVRNVLAEPKDLKRHRVKRSNPAFQRTLGRLKSSELLMHAIGYLGGQNIHSGDPLGDTGRVNSTVNVAFVLQSVSKGGFDPNSALSKGSCKQVERFISCFSSSCISFSSYMALVPVVLSKSLHLAALQMISSADDPFVCILHHHYHSVVSRTAFP